MPVLPIKPEQLATELRARMKKTPKVVFEGLRLGAERGRTHLVRRTPRDLGQMRNAWTVRGLRRGVPFMKRKIVLVNSAPYAGIIELGARPHGVSKEGQENIRAWVRRHFRLVRWSKPSGRSGAQYQVGWKMRKKTDPELDRIVYFIVKKIREKGQKPTYFVRNETDKLTRFAKQAVDRRVREWSGSYARGGK